MRTTRIRSFNEMTARAFGFAVGASVRYGDPSGVEYRRDLARTAAHFANRVLAGDPGNLVLSGCFLSPAGPVGHVYGEHGRCTACGISGANR